jgi:hypothetical protein
MPKPNGFSLTVIVLWVFLALSVIMQIAAPMPPAGQAGAFMAMAKGIAVIATLVSAAIGAVIILFYSKGENWARWVIMVFSVLYILGFFITLMHWSLYPAKTVFSAVQAVFGGYLLWFLNTPPVKGWFEKKLLA